VTLRVAVAGLAHETSSYATDVVGPTDLEAFLRLRDDAIVQLAHATHTYVSGMVTAADDLGVTVVPTYHASAWPSGTITRAAYDTLKTELVEAIASSLPLDGVCLDMHGAGVAEGVDDIEGDIATAVRVLVGPDVPIAGAFDLHGNATDAMAGALDGMFPVHLYPHTDVFERGGDAMRFVVALCRGEIRPAMHLEHVPMLLPPATTDSGAPAAAVRELCDEIETRSGIVSCRVFHGFPYVDNNHVGVHVVCITDGDVALAERTAREVAVWIWDNRESFRHQSQSPDSAVAVAVAETEHPVVINEPSDNPGGGAPGDGTHLLRAMLEAGLTNACFSSIADAAAVATAISAGVGTRVDCSLGGRHGPLHGAPLDVTARVRCITDGRFRLDATLGGLRVNVGPTVLLTIGGLDVIVTSKPMQTFDPTIFALHGIDVRTRRIVGLKGSHHFRAGFRGIAPSIITADSPGLTTNQVELFERTHAPGLLWPIDDAVSYVPIEEHPDGGSSSADTVAPAAEAGRC
jgi:toxic protein SymE